MKLARLSGIIKHFVVPGESYSVLTLACLGARVALLQLACLRSVAASRLLNMKLLKMDAAVCCGLHVIRLLNSWEL